MTEIRATVRPAWAICPAPRPTPETPVSLTLDHINRGADAVERDALQARAYAARHRRLAAQGDGPDALASAGHAAEFDRIAQAAERAAASLRALVAA